MSKYVYQGKIYNLYKYLLGESTHIQCKCYGRESLYGFISLWVDYEILHWY